MLTFKQFILEGVPNFPIGRTTPNYSNSSRIEHVPTEHIIASQHKVSNQARANYVQALRNGKTLKKPHFIKLKTGKYQVLDGHHRVYAHIHTGVKHIEGHVFDEIGNNKTYKIPKIKYPRRGPDRAQKRVKKTNDRNTNSA